MIRTHEAEPGVFDITASLERPPSIYLDHDSFDELARREPLKDRFLDVFRTRGTLLFSWTHVFDLGIVQDRTADLMRAFLDALGPYWIPLAKGPRVNIDGHTLQFRSAIAEQEMDKAAAEYYSALRQLVAAERKSRVGQTFAIWAVPAVALYAIGWALAWVRRGFRNTRNL